MEGLDIRELNERIEIESTFIELLNLEIGKAIVGQKYMIERLLLALLSQGHILLEGVPGLAKTLAIKSLSQAIKADFSRIQFTPDLLPADVVGTMIFNQANFNFEVKKGPIFSNFVLAEPFLVMATQNPIEQEGTYPLPEAQVDRFMLKVNITYPEFEEERQIMRQNVLGTFPEIKPVVDTKTILKARDVVRTIYMDEKIEQYILDIVFATRDPKKYNIKDLDFLIAYGGSPRASISLAQAAKAYAFIKRRGYVIPEDVRAVCNDVLRHRVGITYEAEAENINSEDIIKIILNKVEVP